MKHLSLFSIAFIYFFTSYGQIITTIAGNGTEGYSGDGGQGTKAQINYPIGVCADRQNNVYVAEFKSNCIRKISPDGTISTLGHIHGLSPVGVATNREGIVYVGDYSNNRVQVIDPMSGTMTPLTCYDNTGSIVNFSLPSGLAFDEADNLYVADQGSGQVYKVTGNHATVLASGLPQVTGIAPDRNGNVFASSWNAHKVWKIDVSGNVTVYAGTGTASYSGDNGPANMAALNQPYSIAMGTDGNLYIADDANSRIRKVDAISGIITTILGNMEYGYGGDNGPIRDARICAPAGVFVSANGDMYIADNNNRRIRKITGAMEPLSKKTKHRKHLQREDSDDWPW